MSCFYTCYWWNRCQRTVSWKRKCHQVFALCIDSKIFYMFCHFIFKAILIEYDYESPSESMRLCECWGIPKVIKSLQVHNANSSIQIQGVGLFLNIFVDDPDAKYSVPRARESALTNGLGVVLQDNLENFPKDTKLCAICRKLQNALLKVWT